MEEFAVVENYLRRGMRIQRASRRERKRISGASVARTFCSRADSCITGGLRMQMRRKRRNHSEFALGQKRKRALWNPPCRG